MNIADHPSRCPSLSLKPPAVRRINRFLEDFNKSSDDIFWSLFDDPISVKVGYGAAFNSISPVSPEEMNDWAVSRNVSDIATRPRPTNLSFIESILKAKHENWLPNGFDKNSNLAIAFPPLVSGSHHLSTFLDLGGHRLFDSLWILRGKDLFNFALPNESCLCYCASLIPKGTRNNLENQAGVDVRPDCNIIAVLLLCKI